MLAPSKDTSPEAAPEMQPLQEDKDHGAIAVSWARVLVVLALFMSAAVVGSLAYIVASDHEQEDFETRVSSACIDVASQFSGENHSTVYQFHSAFSKIS